MWLVLSTLPRIRHRSWQHFVARLPQPNMHLIISNPVLVLNIKKEEEEDLPPLSFSSPRSATLKCHFR